jgi:Ni/Co efflux regulator RcnB
MKKLLVALIALSMVAASAAFAGEDCKKCSGADKDAACCCKSKSCDKEKSNKDSSPKDQKPAKETEKKS